MVMKTISKDKIKTRFSSETGYVAVLVPETTSLLTVCHLLNSSAETYLDDMWSSYEKSIRASLKVHGYELEG